MTTIEELENPKDCKRCVGTGLHEASLDDSNWYMVRCQCPIGVKSFWALPSWSVSLQLMNYVARRAPANPHQVGISKLYNTWKDRVEESNKYWSKVLKPESNR